MKLSFASCAIAALPDIREQPPQRQQGPPAVDAAVPVETAEEDRVERARRQRVLVADQHMIELVRIFLRHMAERDARDARGEVGVELVTGGILRSKG